MNLPGDESGGLTELWTRVLAGETLAVEEEARLVAAATGDPAFRRALLDDARVEARLATLGRQLGAAEFVRAVAARLAQPGSPEAAAAGLTPELRDLWTRAVGGEPLGAGEERDLFAALQRSPGMFREFMDDDRLHGLLLALGRAQREAGFAGRVGKLIHAEASGERFVSGLSRRLPERPVARRRPRYAAWATGGGLLAAAAVTLFLVGRDRTGSGPPTVAAMTVDSAYLLVGGDRLPTGAALPAGAAFRAPADQRACLAIEPGARVCLEAATEMWVADDRVASRRLGLLSGKVAAALVRRPAGSGFTITTHAGDITATGTVFTVEAHADGATARLRVLEGTVAVSSRGDWARARGDVRVAAGEGLALESGHRWTLAAEERWSERSLVRGEALSIAQAQTFDASLEAAPPPEVLAAPPDPATLARLARALLQQGRVREAGGIAANLRRVSPASADVARLLNEISILRPAPRVTRTPALYRVNVGGPRYVDPGGNVWSADVFFTVEGSSVLTSASDIGGTELGPLYRDARFDRRPGKQVKYAFPVAEGTYEVRLHFAEVNYPVRGKRVFDVAIEGRTVLANYDIFADVGFLRAAVKPFVVVVADRRLEIELTNVADAAVLAAVEILQVPAGTTTPAPAPPPPSYAPLPLPPSDALYRINAGGGEYVDPYGRLWESNRYANSAGGSFSEDADIAGTELGYLYQSHHLDSPGGPNLRYSLPVPAGEYRVRLHFAEIGPRVMSPGERVFTVLAEGQEILENFDIVAEAGFRKAVIKEFRVRSTDGAIDLEFRHGVDETLVSGIEVLPVR